MESGKFQTVREIAVMGLSAAASKTARARICLAWFGRKL
jgi:hypothetical protein